ncbi:uncharacterized protein METZ01_LOCUS313737, partial [marine metagenome]
PFSTMKPSRYYEFITFNFLNIVILRIEVHGKLFVKWASCEES